MFVIFLLKVYGRKMSSFSENLGKAERVFFNGTFLYKLLPLAAYYNMSA